MLIVPELRKVFILVPRTGTGSFYREMQRVYPRSMLLYRHMEADGVPQGYDRWPRFGFVRHPLARLMSLHRFMGTFAGGAQVQGGAASEDAQRVRRQGERPFEDWLLNNNDPWTVPYDLSGSRDYWPVLARRNPAPENRLSQHAYLRPDLGTTVWKFEDLSGHMLELGLDPTRKANMTPHKPVTYSTAIERHLIHYCSWDLAQNCKFI
jgi:hypothetical protein